MNYLAILKDSLREALDSKVIYFTVGLTVVMLILLAMLSFEPAPADKMMQQLVAGRLRVASDPQAFNRMFLERTQLHFDNLEVVDGTPDSPGSTYRVFFHYDAGSADEAKRIRSNPKTKIEKITEEFAWAERDGFAKISDLRVVDSRDQQANNAQAVRFSMVVSPSENTRRFWVTRISFLGRFSIDKGSLPLGFQLFLMSNLIIGISSWLILLISVIVTAFFVPNMLRKGTVDLLLVKPIHRWLLLLYKYFGGLTFIFLNTALAVGGIWFVLGIRSGIWANSFLLMIFIITLYFVILYSVSTLFGVLTRSPIVAILVTCGVWFLFSLVGGLYNLARQQDYLDTTLGTVIDYVHFFLPRTSDLNELSSRLLHSDFLTGGWAKLQEQAQTPFSWGESLSVSCAFVAIMLGLACWRFARTDY